MTRDVEIRRFLLLPYDFSRLILAVLEISHNISLNITPFVLSLKMLSRVSVVNRSNCHSQKVGLLYQLILSLFRLRKICEPVLLLPLCHCTHVMYTSLRLTMVLDVIFVVWPCILTLNRHLEDMMVYRINLRIE